MMVNPDAILKC